MLALARDMADPRHPAEVCLVLANRPDAGGLARAAALGLPTACVDHRPFRRRPRRLRGGARRAAGRERRRDPLPRGLHARADAGLHRALGGADAQHPPVDPAALPRPRHPCPLPRRRAWRCTAAPSTRSRPSSTPGPILGQAVMPVEPGDTPETLAARLLPLEHRLYPAVLRRFAAGDRGKVALSRGRPRRLPVSRRARGPRRSRRSRPPRCRRRRSRAPSSRRSTARTPCGSCRRRPRPGWSRP